MAVHRHVMHGVGWGWHKSHHQRHSGLFEKNDLYAVTFAAVSIGFFAWGAFLSALWWIGVGMTAYGLLYTLLHDMLVHQRIRFRRRAKSAYLKRLIQAHRLHHAVRERDGAVSFGFLYAPPVAKLVKQMRDNRKSR